MQDEHVASLIRELKALQLRKSVIIAELEEAYSASESANTNVTTSEASVNGIRKGDRVRITNKVKKPASWTRQIEWDEEKERSATVTRVTATQIHFVTDNGVETWRKPNNPERILR